MQEFAHILHGSLMDALFFWGIIPMLGLCTINSIVNICLLPRLTPSEPCNSEEMSFLDVSVLVPARNEEAHLRTCLQSLLHQEPPVREVIVLDDRSTDSTADIARELGFVETEGARLRLLRGKELPEEWVGKNWACHQLSQAANPQSKHLLFTDADTTHGPACLRTALAYAKNQRIDLLSVWPDQITGTWSEKLIIPLLYFVFCAFHPFGLLVALQTNPVLVRTFGLSPRQLSALGAANGQFLLFRREAYESIGGHESLKNHLVEDVAFGRRMAARIGEGMRQMNADGRELLRCRMYSSFATLWEGFSKNLRPVFEESLAGFFLTGIIIFSLFLLPFLFVVSSLPAKIAVSLILLIRLLPTIRFRTAWSSIIAHPVGILIALLIALNSWRLCLGGGVIWKGRLYQGKTRSSLE